MRLLLMLLLGLAGCKQLPDVPTIVSPYRIDIQQGNVVSQDMISKLKVGMTRAQVRFALGSPLVVDAFRTDRWDYVFSLQKQGKELERRRVTVIFDEDKLLRIEGDVVPVDGTRDTESPAQKQPAATTAKPASAKPVAAKPPEKPQVAPQPAAAPAAADKAVAPAADAAKTAPASASKGDAAKPAPGSEKPKERGFFGRMLDKIGF